MNKKPSALDFVGGFEAYQKSLYNSLRGGLLKMSREEISKLQEDMDKDIGPIIDVHGLVEIFDSAKPTRYFSRLEYQTIAINVNAKDPTPENFEVPSQQAPYWEKRRHDFISIGNSIPASDIIDVNAAIRLTLIRENEIAIDKIRKSA